ncbi:hypothetical protein O181_032567 [Austropuccinia psidii MF-1]|uniref:Uncharacterized protein n=1 Tax=Austropuccinia psidii MF-1 TaxID=1389203 RepID=A0A9Q3H6C9_9BASI|nr:hypothetical protein [Austropuccinia psidii MF-1]
MTLLHGCCSNIGWDQVGANLPHHILYGHLAPFGNITFLWPYPAIISLPGQFPYLQPQRALWGLGPLQPVGRNPRPTVRTPRRTLQLISLAIHGGYQKTIQGPQPPGPAGVELAMISGLSQGPFSEVIHHSIGCKGIKYFNTPWTNQLVHTGSNQLYLYALGPIEPIHIPLWELNQTVQHSRWPELY